VLSGLVGLSLAVDAELRSELPPHVFVIDPSMTVVAGRDFFGLLAGIWTKRASTWFSHTIIEQN
jgi:hypothetical protein